jgi:hypothetical protein
MNKTTVRQAKELVSIEAKTEFYELNPNVKYCVAFERPVSPQAAETIAAKFRRLGIEVIVVDANVRIFEFK